MIAGSLNWSAGHWAIGGAEMLRRAGRWWLQEFLALFPAALAEWLTDRGSKSLILSTDQEAVIFELLTDRRRPLGSARVSHTDYTPELIDDFLRAHKLRRTDVSIGARFAPESLFARKLLLPLETRRTLDAVAAQDLLAKTPFRLDDIYHDHLVRRSGDKLCVWQWVVRRQLVSDCVEALGLGLGDLAFVESASENNEPHPCVRLQPAPADQNRWVRRALMGLAFSACVLAVLAVGSQYQRQQQVFDALAAELGTMRAKAQRVRAMLDKLETERAGVLRLRSQKRAPGVLDAWEEVTRVLPSHSWLIELRLSDVSPGREQQLVITGFSPAAASLVGLLDRSPLFGDAALTAPISIDPTEGKERFAIQARLKTLDPLKTAAR
jgi:general secretion pathway protein L